MDIMPTIFDILGLELPGPSDGHSILRRAAGEAEPKREEVHAEVPPAGWQRLIRDERRIRMIRTLDWKLIWNVDLAGTDESFEFYDLKSDLVEQNNIRDPQDDTIRELQRKLKLHFTDHA